MNFCIECKGSKICRILENQSSQHALPKHTSSLRWAETCFLLNSKVSCTCGCFWGHLLIQITSIWLTLPRVKQNWSSQGCRWFLSTQAVSVLTFLAVLEISGVWACPYFLKQLYSLPPWQRIFPPTSRAVSFPTPLLGLAQAPSPSSALLWLKKRGGTQIVHECIPQVD